MGPFLKRPGIFSSLKTCFMFAMFVFSILILFHFIFHKGFTAKLSKLSFSLWIQS